MCGRIIIIIIVKKKCRIAIRHPTAFGVTNNNKKRSKNNKSPKSLGDLIIRNGAK
jgi:hypothetical protein